MHTETNQENDDLINAPFIKSSQTNFASSTWLKYVLIASVIIGILAALDVIFLL